MKNNLSGESAGSFMTIFSLILVVGFPVLMSTITTKKLHENNPKGFSALFNKLKNDCLQWSILNLFKMFLILAVLVFMGDYPCL